MGCNSTIRLTMLSSSVPGEDNMVLYFSIITPPPRGEEDVLSALGYLNRGDLGSMKALERDTDNGDSLCTCIHIHTAEKGPEMEKVALFFRETLAPKQDEPPLQR